MHGESKLTSLVHCVEGRSGLPDMLGPSFRLRATQRFADLRSVEVLARGRAARVLVDVIREETSVISGR